MQVHRRPNTHFLLCTSVFFFRLCVLAIWLKQVLFMHFIVLSFSLGWILNDISVYGSKLLTGKTGKQVAIEPINR